MLVCPEDEDYFYEPAEAAALWIDNDENYRERSEDSPDEAGRYWEENEDAILERALQHFSNPSQATNDTTGEDETRATDGQDSIINDAANAVASELLS